MTGPPPGIVVATSVVAADATDSIVLDPVGSPQIPDGPAGLVTHHDVEYAVRDAIGAPRPLRLDLDVPATAEPAPLVVYLPGGAFMSADRSGNATQRRYVAGRGFAVASVEYRTTTDGARYLDAIDDVLAALHHLGEHQREYGIDASRIALWGRSAGAHVAAMTATIAAPPGLVSVCDQFGPADLATLGADFDVAARESCTAPGNFVAKWAFGADTTKSVLDDPATVALADPANHLGPTTPPFLLLHGTDDHLVSPSQTLTLHRALRAKGIASARYLIVGADHGDLPFVTDATARMAWSTHVVMDTIVDFLARTLG